MNKSHGHTSNGKWSPVYRAWVDMCQRCENPNNVGWKYYGGRGIRVEWTCFKEFLNDMGWSWGPGLTLDRKDNNGNYSKENCRWATRKEQSRNRRSSVFLELGGKIRTISEWSEITGLAQDTVSKRIKSGWSVIEALTTPKIVGRPR